MTQESRDMQGGANALERKILESLQRGNLPFAEILSRLLLERDPSNPKAYNFLGEIARSVNLPEFAAHYFREAVRLAPDWGLPKENLEKAEAEFNESQAGHEKGVPTTVHAGKADRFLLIKAWGYGFWSDVSHVLGQLLVAELSARIPIVHWGSNSLFGDGTEGDAFELYFEQVSPLTVSDIRRRDFTFWPPKWSHRNLTAGEENKWAGSYSRLAGLYLLNRPENVVVSDFHTGIFELMPWIPAGHHLYGLSVDELCRYLVRRYLRPKKAILDEVDRFYATHLASQDYVAVHVRGSDKAVEMGDLDEVNGKYMELVDRFLSIHNCSRIFLMTDDSRILDRFVGTYGGKIVTTDCRRTSGDRGIHYQQGQDGRRLGTEVMVDTYLAARAKAFVGNGFSNPSLMVRYLKDWPEGCAHLISPNMYHTYNIFLHKW